MLYFSTVYMAVIASNLLLILISLCFCNTKAMEKIGYRLLAMFIIFTALRFLLPFETPFSVTVILPDALSLPLGEFQYFRFSLNGKSLSLWNFCELIWFSGVVAGIIHYIILCIRTRNYIILHQKILTNCEPYASLIKQICKEHNKPNRFVIAELPGIDTPMLYGIFIPRILIPENFHPSDLELYCYLSHEATHHFHHDLLMKNIIKLITIAYWWNPFCYILNERTDMILEMRVDDSLTHIDTEETVIYTRCLLDMADRVIDHAQIPKILSMSFLSLPKKQKHKTENVDKRVHMLLSNQEKRNPLITLSLFAIVATIYVFSYIFTLEAYYHPQDIKEAKEYKIMSTTNYYAIINDIGTYDIYYNMLYFETVDSLTNYAEIPVYTKNTCPYHYEAP